MTATSTEETVPVRREDEAWERRTAWPGCAAASALKGSWSYPAWISRYAALSSGPARVLGCAGGRYGRFVADLTPEEPERFFFLG
jgi:hypothetical protein